MYSIPKHFWLSEHFQNDTKLKQKPFTYDFKIFWKYYKKLLKKLWRTLETFINL